MDMLKRFVEIQVNEFGLVINKEYSSNRKIFEDNKLLIFQDRDFFKQHFASYPVIHVNFNLVRGNSFDEILDRFRFVLHETFKQHHYLSGSFKLTASEKEKFNRYYDHMKHEDLTQTNVETGLKFLSECLYKHFNNKQVFVLIDEYDVPFTNAMFKPKINIEDVNELMSQIFLNTLKNSTYVGRALLTGISCFASVALSAVNNINKYMFLNDHPFVEFYGLTQSDVEFFLNKFKIDPQTQEIVKSHYDGYVSLGNTRLFSMWSILHYLKQKEVLNYWVQSGIMANLENALFFPVVRYAIEKLCLMDSLGIEMLTRIELRDIICLRKICLQQGDNEIDELELPDLFLAFLLEHGYLTYEKSDLPRVSRVKIPNLEIKDELQKQMKLHYKPSMNACLEACAVSFNKLQIVDIFPENEVFEELKTNFENVLSKLDFKIIKNNEDAIHFSMFNVLCKTDFSIGTELSFTGGRPDLILNKDDEAFIIDIKYNQKSEIMPTVHQDCVEVLNKYSNVFDEKSSFKNVKYVKYIRVNVKADYRDDIGRLVNCVELEKVRFAIK